MNIEAYREYCLTKKGVTEAFPFDEDVLVFKVMNKIFALSSLSSDPFRVNLKCDPEWAITLREQHDDITPGYHMNKKHWNTVLFETNLDDAFLKQLIDHSYEQVVKSLTKKLQAQLADFS